MRRKIRNDKQRKWQGRRQRVTSRLARDERIQLRVFRSAKHIYAQLIDPTNGRTLGTASTLSKSVKDQGAVENKVEAAKRVGRAIAEVARSKQVEQVTFHRSGFLYHGRTKALADAAREAGLKF